MYLDTIVYHINSHAYYLLKLTNNSWDWEEALINVFEDYCLSQQFTCLLLTQLTNNSWDWEEALINVFEDYCLSQQFSCLLLTETYE